MNNLTMEKGTFYIINKERKGKKRRTQIPLNRIYGFDTVMIKCNKM